MAQLSETVGDDVPTLNEVQQKIEARYAKAKASSRAAGARRSRRACSRSSRPRPTSRPRAGSAELRAELGLDSGPARRPRSSRLAGGSARRRRRSPRPGRPPAQPGTERRRRPRRAGRCGARASGRTTRSSRWMTSWATSRGRSPVRRPATCAERRRRRSAPCPRANDVARRVAHLDDVALVEVAADAGDAGRQQRACRARPARARAPSSTDHGALDAGWRRRSTACAPAGGGRAAGTSCRPLTPATASTSTSGRDRRGDRRPARPTTTPSAPRTASTPCRRCPAPMPGAPAATVEQRVVGEHLLDQRRPSARGAGRRCTGRACR